MEHAERLGHRTAPDAAQPSVGLIESGSIARGYLIADAVVKASPVRLLWARTVSPGHHVTLFAGEVPETTAALERGLLAGGDAVLDHCLIPNVHRDLIAAVRGPRKVDLDEALGVVETSTISAALFAADASAKAAAVELIEVRLAMHLGGKGFYLVAGETGDVEAAVAAGADVARETGALLREVVIPRAAPELLDHIF